MRRIHAHKLGEDLLKFQAQLIEARPENSVGYLRFLISVGPGIHERADSFVASGITYRHFKSVSCRPPFDAKDADAVTSFILKMHRSEISNAIRRNVFARIAHLINQL